MAENNSICQDKSKIAILRIGPVDMDMVRKIQNHLCKVFPEATHVILKNVMPIPQDTYNAMRGQYNSSSILMKIRDYIKKFMADHVLGITDVDLYVPRLNFVFGEAQSPGKTAIISLFRLKPEFYSQPSNRELYIERSIKEAVHEIGHTFGLGHCHNPTCIMFFSNNIQMVDSKGNNERRFCDECWSKVSCPGRCHG